MAYIPLIWTNLDSGEYAINNKPTNQTLFGAIISFAALICLSAMGVLAQASTSVHEGIIYRNPRVYNVEYSFEMFPDPNKIDRSKDLKLWVPIPREWDSQKAVKIISIQPEPHARYVDPEYGNPMLFWDFSKEPEKPSYKVHLKYRLERYEVYTDIDPNRIGPYNKTNKDYILFTQSTNTISITDRVKELAKIAVGDEKNPYLQAKQIFEFVRKKMYYNGWWQNRLKIGTSIRGILESPLIDQKTGEDYYFGSCIDLSTFFVSMCRSVGIPTRNVFAWWDRQDIESVGTRIERGDEPTSIRIERFGESIYKPVDLSVNALAISSGPRGLGIHAWAEIYLPGYGWIPVDPTYEGFGHSYNNKVVIISKGCDIQIHPHAPNKGNESYGDPLFPLQEGRIHWLLPGIWCMANMQRVEIEKLHHPDPFPADALAEFAAKLYPKPKADRNLALYRERALRWIDQNARERADKIKALAQAYRKEPKLRYEHEAFICHMLRKLVGDKKFSDIFETYTNLRVKSGEPVSLDRFQKIAEDIYGQPLDWFFKQWVGYNGLPQLQLDAVTFLEDETGWHVCGNLRQLNKSLFHLPVELVLETDKKTESKTLWLENRNIEFEFNTVDKPKNILVDPHNDILQIRKMPPLLERPSYNEVASCMITDQDKVDRLGWTPLHFAAEAGRTDIVEFLITKGADVNTESRQGRIPLHIAADNGYKEIAELLIAKAADVNAKKSGYTPLYQAIWNKDKDIIKLLVAKGADVNFVAVDEWPVLHCAVRNNEKELVEFFITYGAKLDVKDKDSWTALHHAADRGYMEIVEYLVGKGADINIRENEGKTPLKLAKEKGHTEIVEILRKHGAKE